jgi:hypothetical protein
LIKKREIVRLKAIRNRISNNVSRTIDTAVTALLPTPSPGPVYDDRLSESTVNAPARMTDNSVHLPVSSPTSPAPDPKSSTTSISLDTPNPIPPVRRSERSNKGQYGSTRYFDEVFLTPLAATSECDETTKHLAYLAGLDTCHDTGLENISDPPVYAAKQQKDDPDYPTFQQALNGEHAAEYIQAMKLEVSTLVQQRAWMTIPRTALMNVLKGTWFFLTQATSEWNPVEIQSTLLCSR